MPVGEEGLFPFSSHYLVLLVGSTHLMAFRKGLKCMKIRFPKYKYIMRLISDHVPIALHCDPWDQNKSYFKFENWWLNTEGFTDRISSWWYSFTFHGKPDYILACKLKALKEKLKEWSKEERGNLQIQKTNLLNKMASLDSLMENRALTEDEVSLKATTFMEYEELIKNEEIAWRQWSRILWLKEGDNNTKFFHISANAHKRSNCIDQLVKSKGNQ